MRKLFPIVYYLLLESHELRRNQPRPHICVPRYRQVTKQRTRRCFSTCYTTVWFFLLQLMSSNGTGLLQSSTYYTFCAPEQLQLCLHLSPSFLHLAPSGSTLTPERYRAPQINFFCLGNISKRWKDSECSPFTGEI